MKLQSTLSLILLCLSVSLFSQPETGGNSSTSKAKDNASFRNSSTEKTAYGPLTGVWRGYFTSGIGFFQERYKYEVQLGQLSSNAMKGVTYSYKTTVFYGKANLSGIYTPGTKNLVIKETKLVEVKIRDMSEPCLMTCYLEYSKIGGVEVLEGTFTSVSLKSGNDCGSGKVYLEKVQDSDFEKESFITEYENSKKKPASNSSTLKSRQTPQQDKVTVKPKTGVTVKPKTGATVQPKANTNNSTEQPEKKVKPPLVKIDTPRAKHQDEEASEPEKTTTPKVLKERENALVKTFTVEEGEVLISLYDNGQVDNDTITVYNNRQPVVWRKKLSDKPICIKIKVDSGNPYHELTMVAENLGEIPPNTALMVVTAGSRRYELFITSTEQKNAVVVIELKLPKRDTK